MDGRMQSRTEFSKGLKRRTFGRRRNLMGSKGNGMGLECSKEQH